MYVWVGSTGVGQFYRWTEISGTWEMNLLSIIDFNKIYNHIFICLSKLINNVTHRSQFLASEWYY